MSRSEVRDLLSLRAAAVTASHRVSYAGLSLLHALCMVLVVSLCTVYEQRDDNR